MRKKIIGIILLVLIVFGGYKLFANVSANNVNSNSIQFSYEDIPAYNGDNPYVVVNDNKPYFTSSEIVKDSYIKYGPLDSIKRVTSAMACLDYDSMPSEDDKKGESRSICPTGWNNIKYDSIAGDGYCQSRVQSIAWCLGGSDTDKKNYITATPYMKNYMNAYVVKIARYLEKTSNHVMYRTTPVFRLQTAAGWCNRLPYILRLHHLLYWVVSGCGIKLYRILFFAAGILPLFSHRGVTPLFYVNGLAVTCLR